MDHVAEVQVAARREGPPDFDAAFREQLRSNGPSVLQPKQTLADGARELVRSGITDNSEFERIFSR